MTIEYVLDKVKKLKIKYGRIISNIILPISNLEEEFSVIENEEGIVFIAREENKKRAYFAARTSNVLIELLKKLPKGIVLEYIYKDENDLEETFLKAGMDKYSSYIRVTSCYNTNPYLLPEEGRRKILEDMYDHSYGEYPSISDAKDLYKYTKEIFDPICDDVFSLEEWEKAISNREVLIHKNNDQIVACYVWQLQGKKMYSNLTFNKGTANILYNIERRIFDDMWEKGIRIYYSWFNEKNAKAMKRANKKEKECLKYRDFLYNAIYMS